MDKGHSLPDKKRILANFRGVTLVPVQNGPDRLKQNAKNFDLHKTRFFENGGISLLRQAYHPEHTVAKKLKAGPDEISLPPLVAPAQGTVEAKNGTSESWIVVPGLISDCIA